MRVQLTAEERDWEKERERERERGCTLTHTHTQTKIIRTAERHDAERRQRTYAEGKKTTTTAL